MAPVSTRVSARTLGPGVPGVPGALVPCVLRCVLGDHPSMGSSSIIGGTTSRDDGAGWLGSGVCRVRRQLATGVWALKGHCPSEVTALLAEPTAQRATPPAHLTRGKGVAGRKGEGAGGVVAPQHHPASDRRSSTPSRGAGKFLWANAQVFPSCRIYPGESRVPGWAVSGGTYLRLRSRLSLFSRSARLVVPAGHAALVGLPRPGCLDGGTSLRL